MCDLNRDFKITSLECLMQREAVSSGRDAWVEISTGEEVESKVKLTIFKCDAKRGRALDIDRIEQDASSGCQFEDVLSYSLMSLSCCIVQERSILSEVAM